MEEGIYLVNQSNLDEEVKEFYQLFNDTPKTKSKKSNVFTRKNNFFTRDEVGERIEVNNSGKQE